MDLMEVLSTEQKLKKVKKASARSVFDVITEEI